jgi:hypothetical protein
MAARCARTNGQAWGVGWLGGGATGVQGEGGEGGRECREGGGMVHGACTHLLVSCRVVRKNASSEARTDSCSAQVPCLDHSARHNQVWGVGVEGG